MNTIAYDRLRDEGQGYDPLTGAYHCQHDWDGPRRLSQTVSEVVLALAGLFAFEYCWITAPQTISLA